MVLARDEVQRPAHQPRDDERAVVAHGGVDVGRVEPGRAGAQREPRRPSILRLHGEQRVDEVVRARGSRAVQPLRRRPSRAKLAGRHPAIITARARNQPGASGARAVRARGTGPRRGRASGRTTRWVTRRRRSSLRRSAASSACKSEGETVMDTMVDAAEPCPQMTVSPGIHTLQASAEAAVFDATRLNVFREVVRRGSLSAAAEALSFTQPAVSRQIAALEREAGAQLLERTPAASGSPSAGRVLLGHAEAILDRMSAAHAQLESVARMAGGRLRIGAFQTATATVVARAIAAFAREHPDVELSPRRGGHARRGRAPAGGRDRPGRRHALPRLRAAPTSRWSTSSTTSCSSRCPRRHRARPQAAPAPARPARRDLDRGGGRGHAADAARRRRAGARASSRASASPPSSGCRSRAWSRPASGSRSSPAWRSRAVRDDIVLRSLGPHGPRRRVVVLLPAGYRAPAAEPFVALLQHEAAEHGAALDERARRTGPAAEATA